ncbi:transglutaminase family protein [Microvirga terrae]|uniref:Transglutaminase family protein n=1 Tax=Microvirga terrae TaxID=2740529 RepID=A0ABY5RVS4_9HYPH|nr:MULTISPECIES: transglutaminase family protein [Microvirga]MBQ0824120.1 transglutaminase family protein [Microvirga sp. HBU67558]UVF20049.1 transglutaminase family protein [Microvirga terrae]
MRIRITHETVYHYSEPAKSAIQLLRLTPRGSDNQTVLSWTIDMDGDGRLMRREDWYGNIVHSLSVSGPVSQITLRVAGEVETTDTAGLVRGGVERFPELFYLRETPLTRPDAALREFAGLTAGRFTNPLDQAHALMNAIPERLRFDTQATSAATAGADAFAAGHGVCQDFTHVFLSAARLLRIPARYVSGYLHKPGETEQEAGHAWAEAHLPDLGWVSFDPANAVSATEHYVRLAIGLDYLDAAPVRGSYYGITREALDVRLRIESARQAQA